MKLDLDVVELAIGAQFTLKALNALFHCEAIRCANCSAVLGVDRHNVVFHNVHPIVYRLSSEKRFVPTLGSP